MPERAPYSLIFRVYVRTNRRRCNSHDWASYNSRFLNRIRSCSSCRSFPYSCRIPLGVFTRSWSSSSIRHSPNVGSVYDTLPFLYFMYFVHIIVIWLFLVLTLLSISFSPFLITSQHLWWGDLLSFRSFTSFLNSYDFFLIQSIWNRK